MAEKKIEQEEETEEPDLEEDGIVEELESGEEKLGSDEDEEEDEDDEDDKEEKEEEAKEETF